MSVANQFERQMLQLINEERAALGIDPLRLDLRLNDSSEDHSEWMLAADTFSHTGQGGSNPGDRMRDADFEFSGSWTHGENVAWQTERGASGLADDVVNLHESLMNSPGHRANILNSNFEVIGIGIETGDYSGWDAVMVTQNFARSSAPYQFDAPSQPTAPALPDPLIGNSGDNQLMGSAGDDDMRGRAGDDLLKGFKGHDTLDGGGDNDVVRGFGGNDHLVGGAGKDLLAGGGGVDILAGGKGRDTLNGKKGADVLNGNWQGDTLKGAAGDDLLIGGRGNDTLNGGKGGDTFMFRSRRDGDDTIRDFQEGIDQIDFTRTNLEFDDLAIEQQGAHTVIEYGASQITLRGIDADTVDAECFLF